MMLGGLGVVAWKDTASSPASGGTNVPVHGWRNKACQVPRNGLAALGLIRSDRPALSAPLRGGGGGCGEREKG